VIVLCVNFRVYIAPILMFWRTVFGLLASLESRADEGGTSFGHSEPESRTIGESKMLRSVGESRWSNEGSSSKSGLHEDRLAPSVDRRSALELGDDSYSSVTAGAVIAPDKGP